MKFIGDNLDWIVPSLIALAALGFAWWSSVSAHAAKKWAVRSAEAAEQSAQADAEQTTMMRSDRDAAEKQLRQRPWASETIGKNKVRYVNTASDLYNVDVELNGLVLEPEVMPRMQHGESFVVSLTPDFENPSREVAITWSETDSPDAARLTQKDLPR